MPQKEPLRKSLLKTSSFPLTEKLPDAVAYVPAGANECDGKYPAAGVHFADPAADTEFAGQLEQLAWPQPLYVPGSHAVQTPLAPALASAVPAAHA